MPSMPPPPSPRLLSNVKTYYTTDQLKGVGVLLLWHEAAACGVTVEAPHLHAAT
jgi:hypothetical protein